MKYIQNLYVESSLNFIEQPSKSLQYLRQNHNNNRMKKGLQILKVFHFRFGCRFFFRLVARDICILQISLQLTFERLVGSFACTLQLK